MYWKPPSVALFDPVPQPLTWEFRNGQRTPIGQDADSYVWRGYGVPLFKGGSGQANQRIVTQSDADKIAYYQKLIDARTPDDPPNGGLAGDTYDPVTGEIRINYFDAADSVTPYRKQVSYYPHGSHGISVSVHTWNPQTQQWEPEGFDFQRDFSNALPDIIKVFGAATTAIVGLITANPAIAAAWNQVFQTSSAPVYGGPPPSITDFAQQATSFFGAAPGFGDTMSDLVQNKLFKQSLFGNIGKLASSETSQFGHEVSSFLDKLKKSATDFAAAFPHIDLGAAAQGIIPPDVQHAADNAAKGLTDFDLDSYKLATKAFFNALTDQDVQAVRKAAFDKSTFDATYAELQAEQSKRNLISEVTQEFFPTLTIGKRTQADSATGIAGQKMVSAIQHIISPEMADLISYVRQLQLRYGLS